MSEQPAENKKNFRQRLAWRFNQRFWPIGLVPIRWLFFHTSLRSDHHQSNFMSGLREFCWSYICGYSLREAWRIGCIWWRNG